MSSEIAEQTLTNHCYVLLKESIVKGKFLPDEKLRVSKLKSLLNTGPTPIREALSRLALSGLIEIKDNRGFYVKSISEAEVKDIYATFNKIEVMALNQSIELGDVNWEATILSALHKLSTIETKPPPIDSSIWLQFNHEFHYSLISACNSPCLLKIRQDLYQLFDRYCHLSFLINEDSLLLNHQDHCEITKAVLNRDKHRACELTTKHLENSLADVIERLKKNNFF